MQVALRSLSAIADKKEPDALDVGLLKSYALFLLPFLWMNSPAK